MVSNVDAGCSVHSLFAMTLITNSTTKKFTAAMRRRNARLARASVDISADLEGRRISGDPHLALDFALAGQQIRQ